MKIQDFNTKKKIFLIAEIGNNHEGSLKIAKKLIFLAKKNGANAVKFQYINPEKLVNKKIFPDKINFLKKICLNIDQFHELEAYSKKIGIIFLCSIFDYTKINEFKKIVPAFKIASGDNNLINTINHVAKFNKPILLSTGMLKNDEIKTVINKINIKKNQLMSKLCVLHCVSNYPLKNKDINLQKIDYLKKLNVTIGYSDHSIGIQACIVAASLGARVIEKHFTIDHNFSDFRDHQLSMNPEQLKILSKSLKEVNEILGKNINTIPTSEKNNISNNRRGIYSKIKISKGQKIKNNNIILLRPEGKLSAFNLKKILGKRVKKDIKELEELTLDKII